MPSYLRNPHRAYSFPPWIEAAENEASQLPDIDEDPFAHFITPISEAEDPYELALSAGIDGDEGPRTTKASKFKSNVANKWARYVRHNHGQLHTHPSKNSINETHRGRAQDLAARKQQNRRRYSRTLSGHRHSWREPSPDLFTVDESEEEELPVLRRPKTRKPKEGAERRRSSTRSKSRARVDVAEKSRL
ncbi:hypothetical protein A1F94_002052 [Pyrenophora tritici-repentis]|uniref:Uncharacterized protein n=1 Tax=Pyrenophora tritici-repentis TaxID=45151 RepID=A0A317A1Y0_9PLEO|nr:hypothetical protein PtrV1_02634 [Pyrenophora tritici-repentis]KAF7455416.1 hypothetical protein A1F99_026740 [Pyrenophora tritici-repentis]KAF7578605.1 hypothetical protein PtrM4_028450 [Pyrenophora tritici-repentis]KAG9389159.1 hypothetical protein A1F94_002052 [Pyrenophora tritici-repentis]KAI0575426.1 hypothetical protein Alg215_08021 [Pyrenophora tritici-repentis]